MIFRTAIFQNTVYAVTTSRSSRPEEFSKNAVLKGNTYDRILIVITRLSTLTLLQWDFAKIVFPWIYTTAPAKSCCCTSSNKTIFFDKI